MFAGSIEGSSMVGYIPPYGVQYSREVLFKKGGKGRVESGVKFVRNTKGDEALFFIACVIRARPLCTLNPVFSFSSPSSEAWV